MIEIDWFYLLIAVLLLFGLPCIILHTRAYTMLYQSLRDRDIAGKEYAPDWASKIGALGCMGFITRMKREIGADCLTAEEVKLLANASGFYYAGTFSTFAALCLLFVKLYGLP